ncbi:methyltransferase domain-containing protein [Brachybacterium sp. YJGR34]|uniref:methyltransferase domain-containing protein n=1 Tax=Brachybacterium sp. YJGR34 TaxID=2059911 RepID=UPI0035141A6F
MSAPPLPPVLATLDPEATHREVEELLLAAGWSRCGAGDWAIALASPDGELAARISPFDPVGPFTARLYDLAAPSDPVPRLLAHRRLAGGGDLQVMERLTEAPPKEAEAFLESLSRPDPALAPLAEVVRHVHDAALRELPWCGPLDTNPSNVMRAADGHLVLIDPFYADGPNLYAMAERSPDLFVATIPEHQRRFLTEIPLTESGPWPAAERNTLRERLEQADRRRVPAQQLMAEAAAADVDGWGFGWLEGRATEERPPWGYSRLLAGAVAAAQVAIDLDTGGGEVLDRCPRLAAQQHVTEGWAPNAARARERLGPRGVIVHEVAPGARIPVEDGTADLVTSRHPVAPDWPEIARVLAPGGEYLGQHVGPASAFELIEHFIGPTTAAQRRGRHPEDEAEGARAAGLEIVELRTARLRMEFFDVGAVVWILRKCVWWVPDFSVERYSEELLAMDALIRREGSFVAHSTRHLLRARA